MTRSYKFLLFVLFSLCICELSADEEALANSLKSSRWYDFEKKDYHKFSPDDINIPEQRQKKSNPRLPNAPATGALFQDFIRVIFILLLAIPVIGLLYLLFRIAKEQWGRKSIIAEDRAHIEHTVIPNQVATKTGLKGPVTMSLLEKRIVEALERKELLLVAILIYLYCLLQLQSINILQLHIDATAREYLQIIRKQKSSLVSEEGKDLFSKVVDNFEYAMYRESLKEGTDQKVLWSRVSTSFQRELF